MKITALTLLSLTLLGCSGTQTTSASKTAEDQSPQVTEAKEEKEQNMITVTGTIRYKSIEGGFFALDADNGDKYMPHGMDKTLLRDGMVVEVTGVIMKDMMTFQQYGEVLKVKESKMLDDTKVKPLPSEY